MAQHGGRVFTNCWRYDDTILVIDAGRDEVVDSIRVGIQPTSLAIDRHGKLWVLTDGGFEGNPYGYEAPALYRIDAESHRIEQKFTFVPGDHPSELCLNGTGDELYWLNRSVWRMGVRDDRRPAARQLQGRRDPRRVLL